MKRKSSPKNKSLLKKEKILIGVDEAGRGPLAGPVVAGAVLFNNSLLDKGLGIRDSKKLTPKKREKLFFEILKRTGIGIGIIHEKDIDRMNIYRATILAMENAVLELLQNIKGRDKDKIRILVDGNMKLDLPYKIKCIIRGDSKITCIAAASIIAKVTRDRIMYLYDMHYPQYGFKAHKGYPTKAHFCALEKYGPSPIHRRSFRPVRIWDEKN